MNLKFDLSFTPFLRISGYFSEFALNTFPLKLVFRLKSSLLFLQNLLQRILTKVPQFTMRKALLSGQNLIVFCRIITKGFMIRHNISGILKSQEPKTCLSLCSQNNLAAAQNCRATECSYVPSRLVLFVSSACNRE